MTYDWSYVKNTTLWGYESLISKLDAVLAYPVIRQAYNHSMPQATDFAGRLFSNKEISSGEYPAAIVLSFRRLQAAGVTDWANFLSKVATGEACVAFIEQNHLAFEEVIDVLGYLLRWALPFHTATRELLDHEDAREMAYYAIVKQYRLMCSFDLLERGVTEGGRRSLAQQTSLPPKFVTALVHRADIARLPYVRRKTILPVCGAGYDTLAKIAAANLPRMEADMEAFLQRTQRKKWADFKSVILLRGLIAGAQALPEIISA